MRKPKAAPDFAPDSYDEETTEHATAQGIRILSVKRVPVQFVCIEARKDRSVYVYRDATGETFCTYKPLPPIKE